MGSMIGPLMVGNSHMDESGLLQGLLVANAYLGVGRFPLEGSVNPDTIFLWTARMHTSAKS